MSGTEYATRIDGLVVTVAALDPGVSIPIQPG